MYKIQYYTHSPFALKQQFRLFHQMTENVSSRKLKLELSLHRVQYATTKHFGLRLNDSDPNFCSQGKMLTHGWDSIKKKTLTILSHLTKKQTQHRQCHNKHCQQSAQHGSHGQPLTQTETASPAWFTWTVTDPVTDSQPSMVHMDSH